MQALLAAMGLIDGEGGDVDTDRYSAGASEGGLGFFDNEDVERGADDDDSASDSDSVSGDYGNDNDAEDFFGDQSANNYEYAQIEQGVYLLRRPTTDDQWVLSHESRPEVHFCRRLSRLTAEEQALALSRCGLDDRGRSQFEWPEAATRGDTVSTYVVSQSDSDPVAGILQRVEPVAALEDIDTDKASGTLQRFSAMGMSRQHAFDPNSEPSPVTPHNGRWFALSLDDYALYRAFNAMTRESSSLYSVLERACHPGAGDPQELAPHKNGVVVSSEQRRAVFSRLLQLAENDEKGRVRRVRAARERFDSAARQLTALEPDVRALRVEDVGIFSRSMSPSDVIEELTDIMQQMRTELAELASLSIESVTAARSQD